MVKIVPPFFINGSARWAIRMNDQQEIETSPFLLYELEHLLRLPLHIDVERHEYRRFESLCKRLDMLFRAIVQVGDGEISPERAKGPGAPPGDRLVVGDADDQTLFILQGDLGLREHGNIHDTLSRFALGDGLLNSNDSVCWAI